jgi:type IV secretory pathway TrbD component
MSNLDRDDGFEVPLHRSLTEPILLGGLPRNFALAYWTFAAGLSLGAHQWWFALIAAGGHVAGSALTKNDPYVFDILRRAVTRGQRRLDP